MCVNQPPHPTGVACCKRRALAPAPLLRRGRDRDTHDQAGSSSFLAVESPPGSDPIRLAYPADLAGLSDAPVKVTVNPNALRHSKLSQFVEARGPISSRCILLLNHLTIVREEPTVDSLVEDLIRPVLRYTVDFSQVRQSVPAPAAANVEAPTPIRILTESLHPLAADRTVKSVAAHS